MIPNQCILVSTETTHHMTSLQHPIGEKGGRAGQDRSHRQPVEMEEVLHGHMVPDQPPVRRQSGGSQGGGLV